MVIEIFDTHAHLDHQRFEGEHGEVIASARDSGVSRILNIGADLQSSQKAIALAEEYSCLSASVGLHPHGADLYSEQLRDTLKELVSDPSVLAIGETGLDYHYDNSPRDQQREAFKEQIALAREVSLPLIIHSRDADRDTEEILTSEKLPEPPGIMHCFAGDRRLARTVLDAGFLLACGGVLTFRNAGHLRHLFREYIPLESTVLETDAPYLAPEPRRGDRNEPAFICFVAKRLADLLDIDLETVAETTTQNAAAVLGVETGTGE